MNLSKRNKACIVLLVLFNLPLFPQLNLTDTFNLVIVSDDPDSVKIDRLNQYIFSYAPNQPGTVSLYADTAILLSLGINDSLRLAHSFSRKGLTLYFLGDNQRALENYFRAIKIKQEAGLENTLWREYNNIGIVLRFQNQHEEALRYFDMSVKLFPAENRNYIALGWNNIAICYRGMQRLNEARKALETALAICLETNEKQTMALVYNNLGIVYYNQQNYSQAIDFYNNALAINLELLNNFEVAENLNNLAKIYLDMAAYDRSMEYLTKAEEYIKIINSEQLLSDYLNIKTDFYVRKRDYRSAYYCREEYSRRRDSVFRSSRANQFDQLRMLAGAENEMQKVDFLKRINKIQLEKIKIRRGILLVTSLIITVLLLLLLILLRNNKMNRHLGLSLKMQAEDLSSVNEELNLVNEELLVQQEELQRVLSELKTTQHHLVQSEKMASLGILAAGVAHEINNPLNYIMGGITGIETFMDDNSQIHGKRVQPLIEDIVAGINQVAAIVISLNQYSRQDDTSVENCNIHTIIDNCLVMLQSQTKDRIQIRLDYSVKDHTLKCKESKMHQALLNILANAVQSIEKEGIISVSTKTGHQALSIVVEDNGIRIHEDDYTNAYDPALQLKTPDEGRGLGLSIAQAIIREHDGKITRKSAPGKGTRIEIHLPLKTPDMSAQ